METASLRYINVYDESCTCHPCTISFYKEQNNLNVTCHSKEKWAFKSDINDVEFRHLLARAKNIILKFNTITYFGTKGVKLSPRNVTKHRSFEQRQLHLSLLYLYLCTKCSHDPRITTNYHNFIVCSDVLIFFVILNDKHTILSDWTNRIIWFFLKENEYKYLHLRSKNKV